MKLGLAAAKRLFAAALLPFALASTTGCAARPAPPPVTSTTPLTSADFADPAWNPPDASGTGLSVDDGKLADPAPAPRRAPRPRHEPAPNGHEAPRGSVRAAKE